MTAATGVSRQAQDYLAAVEHELADLPVDDRSALLEDLTQHLEALTAEDDDRPIAVRLGPPAGYAAELRAAAGLPARGSVAGTNSGGLREWVDSVRSSAAFQRALPALRETERLRRELRPAWWVLRGYLLVLIPCLLETDGVRDFPVPAPLGSHELGFLLVVAAVVGSVALGRRTLPRRVRGVVVAGGVVLVLLSAVAWENEWDQQALDYSYASYAPPPVYDRAVGEYPLLSRYGPVTDVFPYAADGTPLEGVLLYDQDGRPLHVGFQEWWADGCARVLVQPPAADGVPVPNSYPQSYELHPDGVSVDGPVLSPGARCETDVPRPDVPLPTFPAEVAAPTPGD